MPTFLTNLDHKFQPVAGTDDGEVRAGPFLQAATKVLLVFVHPIYTATAKVVKTGRKRKYTSGKTDMLGKAFTPVKSDIEGNIYTLKKKYDQDPERYQGFRVMLEEEIANGTTKKKGSAAIALLWLTRALYFIQLFMHHLVADHRSGAKTENMTQFVKMSYEQSLKCYHGWIVQKVFAVVSHAVPWRRDFLKPLANGQTGYDDEVIDDMEEYLKDLGGNLSVLDKLLKDLGLDSKERV